MEINFKCEGLDAWLAKLKTLQGFEKDPRIDKALGRGAARMQGIVKDLTPVGTTGNLQNKIFIDHVGPMSYSVETNVEYAAYVEFGTGKLGDPAVPHTSKEYWTYYSEALQKFITTHGQEPAHMFTKGFTQHKKVTEIVRAEIKEIIKNA
ncbi:HK97-gp10 family putative phage morphogenesis protein [Ruminococcus sp.]|uniref:HK97-gp10 family putative phage morphogenesis protein n=1 Tax=Ruminococcus sp. TaxID=41978 RepID=UPI001B4A5B2E|nr:HK97-gp10 family putative phage morphogenesis protein [Ruminococcus sp.]MBP5432196.1 HK97 gp10 family phage protein [Ruminococcus sp.]